MTCVCFSVEVVTAASTVLKAVLATQAGFSFAADYKAKLPDCSLFQYLHPFKTHRKKVRVYLF